MKRPDELAELIKRYQQSYYNGEAEISDSEFDLLWDELKGLAPDHPLLAKVGRDSIDGFPKARHLIPMGSQEKADNRKNSGPGQGKLHLFPLLSSTSLTVPAWNYSTKMESY